MKELTSMEKKEIEQLAEGLLTNEVFDGQAVKIVSLANSLGFAVGHANLPEGTEGIIAVDKAQKSLLGSGSNQVIAIDYELNKERMRFIIAHELGHYMMRKDANAPVFAHRETAHGRSEAENEADYFAACLLMPKDGFKAALEYFRQVNPGIDDDELAVLLSEQFKVQTEAAKRRIKEVDKDVDTVDLETPREGIENG